MNWKLVIVGGLAMYLVMFAVSMATGPILHNGLFKDTYQATESFWRPELNQDPPDVGSLMPRWVGLGILTSFIFAAIYGCLRPALGRGWVAGVKFGVIVSVLGASFMAGWSGIFNLPDKLWVWWALEQPLYYIPGGAILGWLGEKLAPSD